MPSGFKQDLSIGKNLRKLRKQAGFTLAAASAQLELMGFSMTPEIMAKMEQGRYSIKIGVLIALKRIYHVNSFDAFFEDLDLKEIL